MSLFLARYRRSLRARLAELERASEELALDPRAEQRAREIAHVLKGSGTSYGYPQVTDAAAALEELEGDAFAPGLEHLIATARRALDQEPAENELFDADEIDERPAIRIVVVDDASDVRLLARHSLEHDGFEVTTTSGGDRTVALIRERRPDAVLLDLLMPSPDGLELFEQLRARPETADLPVIFLTGQTRRDEVARLERRGALGVIAKPFDPLTLPGQVRRLLAPATARDEEGSGPG